MQAWALLLCLLPALPAAPAPLPTTSTSTSSAENAAETPDAPLFVPARNLHLELGLTTQVPLFVGATARLEGPLGLFVDAGVGVMPAPYFALINGVVVAVGGYNEATADLLGDALENSVVVQVSGGWRPLSAWGLEVFGGYTFAAASGALPAVATVAAVVGTEVPNDVRDLDVPLHTALHAVHGGLAWRFDLWEGLYLRPSLAYVQVLGSSSALDVDAADLDRVPARAQPRAEAALTGLSAELDAYLNETYTTWVKSPVVGVTVGWRFPP